MSDKCVWLVHNYTGQPVVESTTCGHDLSVYDWWRSETLANCPYCGKEIEVSDGI